MHCLHKFFNEAQDDVCTLFEFKRLKILQNIYEI